MNGKNSKNSQPDMGRRGFITGVAASVACGVLGGQVLAGPARHNSTPKPTTVTVATLSIQTFLPLIGKKFLIYKESKVYIEYVLKQVVPLSTRVRGLRPQPFTCYFQSTTSQGLPQETYFVHEADIGTLQLFCVPSGGNPRNLEILFT